MPAFRGGTFEVVARSIETAGGEEKVKVLLDTNAISELYRPQRNETFLRAFRMHRRSELAISAISVFELRRGCQRMAKHKLWARIHREVVSQVDVLPIGTIEAECAGDVAAQLESAGRRIEFQDLLIGSSALAHGLPVVTRNVRDFSRIAGLRLLDWWAEE